MSLSDCGPSMRGLIHRDPTLGSLSEAMPACAPPAPTEHRTGAAAIPRQCADKRGAGRLIDQFSVSVQRRQNLGRAF